MLSCCVIFKQGHIVATIERRARLYGFKTKKTITTFEIGVNTIVTQVTAARKIMISFQNSSCVRNLTTTCTTEIIAVKNCGIWKIRERRLGKRTHLMFLASILTLEQKFLSYLTVFS
jgi:hypothetical protein